MRTEAEVELRRAPQPPPGRRPSGEFRPLGPRRLVQLGLVFYGVLLAIAWVWRELAYGERLLYASPAPAGGVQPLRDVALGLGLAAAVILASGWLTHRTRAGAALARSLARALGPLEWRHCLALALASGIGEEAFFRGALQPRVGLLAASLLFAAAHFVPRRDLALWSLFSLVAGLLLGGLYEWTGNLVAPTVAHVTVNAVNLRRLVREFGDGAIAVGETPRL